MEQLVRDYVGYLLKGLFKQQEQKDHEQRKNVVQTLKEENVKAAASLEDALQSEKERQRAKLQLLLRQRRASVSGLTATRASASPAGAGASAGANADSAHTSGAEKRFAATAASFAVTPLAAVNGDDDDDDDDEEGSAASSSEGDVEQMMFPSVASFGTPIAVRVAPR